MQSSTELNVGIENFSGWSTVPSCPWAAHTVILCFPGQGFPFGLFLGGRCLAGGNTAVLLILWFQQLECICNTTFACSLCGRTLLTVVFIYTASNSKDWWIVSDSWPLFGIKWCKEVVLIPQYVLITYIVYKRFSPFSTSLNFKSKSPCTVWNLEESSGHRERKSHSLDHEPLSPLSLPGTGASGCAEST